MNPNNRPKQKPDLKTGAATQNAGTTEAAQRCKMIATQRLLHKRWTPKRLEKATNPRQALE